MRYKPRSCKKSFPGRDEPRSSISDQTVSESEGRGSGGEGGSGSPPAKQRKTIRRIKTLKKPADSDVVRHFRDSGQPSLTIFSLPQDVILHLVEKWLDLDSSLSFLRTCGWFYHMLNFCESYWKALCIKTEFASYSCLEESNDHLVLPRLGWSGTDMHKIDTKVNVQEHKSDEGGEEVVKLEMGNWRKTFLRGIKMRQNVVASNYQGWRLFSNSDCPVTELTPGLDMNTVKQRLGEFPKLSVNDDLKIDWDDKHLVLFHFFRGEGESCTIRVWDISDEPKFLYQVDKGIECITDKISVHDGHVVMVPSWPLEAHGIVMTLNIRNNMAETGKYLFPDEASKTQLDENWEHTQLRVVRCKAMVVCRAPEWRVVITSLPDCTPLTEILLSESVCSLYECQQIRSYKSTAIVLFTQKKAEHLCCLVTMDIKEGMEDTKAKTSNVRSCHTATHVTDVALYTDPEEIYLMKKNGNVVLYDATKKLEAIKITNRNQTPQGSIDNSDYQLFVNGKEQICVMQSAPEAQSGRNINVYSYEGAWMYEINLDLYKYGLSRDESVCIYTNAAFLAAADSKRFVLFNVKNGKYVGVIQIPSHLERSKGKDEKDCMFEQTGLGLFIFDENKLIAVHDYERSFPAVLDIYKFW